MFIYGIHISNLFIWLLFGAVIGAIIHLIDSGRVKGGIFSTVILGMMGALFGGFVSTLFLDKAFLTLITAGLAVAIIASIHLAVFARVIFRSKEKNHIKTITTYQM